MGARGGGAGTTGAAGAGRGHPEGGPRWPSGAQPPPRRARLLAKRRQWPLLCALRPRADGPQLQRPQRPPGPTWQPGPPQRGAGPALRGN